MTKVTNYETGGQIDKTVEYVYDTFDRRVSSKVTDYTTNGSGVAVAGTPVVETYVYDEGAKSRGDVILDFVDSDGPGGNAATVSKRYLWGQAVDQLFAQEDVTQGLSDTDRYAWLLQDRLNTVREVLNRDGTVAAHIDYTSFGEIESVTDASGSPTALPTRFTFTGQEFDSNTGQYWFSDGSRQGRVMSPGMMRFIQPDPGGFIDGLNLVIYVHNSPTNATDPSGQAWSWLAAGAGALVGGASAAVVGAFTAKTSGEFWGTVASGAAAGAIAGGILGAATGDPTFAVTVGVLALSGAVGGATGSVVRQGIDTRTVSPGEVVTDAAIEGAVSAGTGGLLRGAKKLAGPVIKYFKPPKTAPQPPKVSECAPSGTTAVCPPTKGPAGFSNPAVGNDIHDEFGSALAKQTGTKPSDWIMRTRPGQNGVDAEFIGPSSRHPGFTYGELKPFTQHGFDTFMKQLDAWNLPPGQTQLWFYNRHGIIGSSGLNY